ncbi:hypothetical protein MYP_4244 [Sporocytophaga myxococcoides]|uniref:Uncharacterized protein n=1 Tax=Sporocytophaga myxococcoides TaxID=153721 RepID=A0A098LKK2_9BACT|nr:hypothetical protein [Sporocytophaga myxococcoides]GAL87014.1 hypothetical protein MYP_4244 [Sporocytophaga myxococcoides]
MKKFFKYSIKVLFLPVIFSGCVSLEKATLDDSHQLAVAEDPEFGVPVLKFNKGVVEGFSNEIYSWWVANDQLALAKKGDTLKIQMKNVGPKWECFGSAITMLDFTEASVLKLRMRSEGATAPNVSIRFRDANGYMADMIPNNKVPKNEPYQDFYYNFTGKWKQAWPESKDVDPKIINEVLFFINGGGSPYTGTLYIDEIKAIPLSELPAAGPAAVGGIIDDFSEPIDSWWAADKINLMTEGEELAITATGAGPGYECFGRAFSIKDFNKADIVRVKAKAIGDSEPILRGDVKDSEGRVTNSSVIAHKIALNEYRDYFYDYKGKFSQVYPDNQTVNPAEIKDILFFINPGGPAFEGKIYVDEIEVITRQKYNELTGQGKVEEKKEESSSSSSSNTTTPGTTETESAAAKETSASSVSSATKTVAAEKKTAVGTKPVAEKKAEEPAVIEAAVKAEDAVVTISPVNSKIVNLDNFKDGITKWYGGSDKVKLSKVGEDLKVELNGVGPMYETFGRGFLSTDFSTTPVVKVRVKADKAGQLRLDVKDIDGYSTNLKPVVQTIAAGTDFVDLYFDFTDKFEQSFPTKQKVNPAKIVQVLFYVNPGGKAFTGTLVIDEIKIMTADDAMAKK